MDTIMIKKIAFTAVLAAVSPALASDNFEIFGPGTQTCGQYLASHLACGLECEDIGSMRRSPFRAPSTARLIAIC
jgi:hypothetical protein